MCGICGFTGPGNRKLAIQMADAIRHRGPDEEGIWQDEEVTLCSRRLSIVDIESGKQPMCSPEYPVSLVWNGEVYNHRPLRRELENEGHSFHTDHSDTETLLHLYLQEGPSFVNRLNGMFAIAIWDRREHKLLLYRDRMGVKPLYYCHLPGKCFLFSSEIKSILLHPDYRKRVNDAAIYEYFSYKNIHAPQTVFQDIWEVMPGQMLQWQEDHLISDTYWDLGDYYAEERIPFDPVLAEKKWIPEITEQLFAILQDAVKIRLEADVEVGSFLSGGLDSSFVSAMAAKHQPGLKCFTLGHEVQQAREYDKQSDVKQAVRLADQMGMQHTIHTITARDVIERMENIVTCFDQPFSGAVSTYLMSEVMSKQVKTALSGDGADELFGSYLPHMLSFPMEYYKRQKEQGGAVKPEKLKPLEGELEYLEAMYQFSKGDPALLSYRMLLLTDEEKQLFLGERLTAYAQQHQTLKQVQQDRAELHGADALNRDLEYDGKVLLPNQVLKYSDALSMAHSLEIRTPFLDHRLVEYVAGISGRYKMYGGETKYLLKRVAENILPKDLIYRPKEGFVMPVNDWLPHELKEYVFDTLSMEAVARYDYLRPEAVYYILSRYYSAPEANSSLAGTIWNFVCFQKWCERYM